jgi:hypothetical protein
MNGYATGRQGGAAAVLAIAAGLVLVGCGGSAGSLGSGGTSSSPATSSSSAKPASSGSSSSSAATSVTAASTLPFPVGAGDTWTYKTTLGQVVNKMTAVVPASGGQKVTMATTATVDGTTTRNTGYYVVYSNGEISLPFSQFDTSSSSASVRLISGGVYWPPAAQLAAGHASHSTLRIEFSENGVTEKVDAHVTVKGAGTQTVTVPAGTYRATVVNMTMSETIDGITVSTEVRTWLATGVGPVQSEVFLDEDGTNHVAAKDQLVSFKAG